MIYVQNFSLSFKILYKLQSVLKYRMKLKGSNERKKRSEEVRKKRKMENFHFILFTVIKFARYKFERHSITHKSILI